jgi:uncharacterized membrane protein YcaP (DUF421 family)
MEECTVFDWNIELLEVVLRTGVVYLFLLAGMRLAGKRELGQLTPFDLVLLLTISNAVQNAMVGEHVSVTAGMVAATTLLVLNYTVSAVTYRSKGVRWLVEGTPTVLITNGHVVEAGLRHERLTREELEAAVREHGLESTDEVDLALMEVDGTISVIKYEDTNRSDRRRSRRGFRQLKQKP